MKKDPQLYVIHILQAVANIEEYAGDDYEAFCKDRKAYDAILRNLQTMSESTKHLPDEVKARHQAIDWRAIAGFRNILVHDYLEGIEQRLIWDIIKDYVPMLKDAMLLEKKD